MKVVSPVRVKQAQVDELGHLNHVAAVDILQYARDDWYQAAELWDGRAWSGAENLGTLVLNININYRLECFLDEELQVTTASVNRGSKSFVLAQEIVKPDGSVAIDAMVTSLIMDMEKHVTLTVPDRIARYLPPRDVKE